MSLLHIPLTFGQVIREEGRPRPPSAMTGNLDQLENTQMDASFRTTRMLDPDEQHMDDFSARSFISSGSTNADRSSTARLSFPRVGSTRYNGSISSVQMILLLIAISSSAIIAAQLSQDFKPVIGMLPLIAYMLIGLVVMVMFFKFRRLILVKRSNNEDLIDTERDNLILIGLVIFYLLVCLLDMFYIAALLSCHEVWTICSSRDIYFSFVTEVFFHFARIAYLGVKTTFCITFHRSTFEDNVLTRYGLMFLQAVNISLWFDALIQESIDLSGHNKSQVDAYSDKCHINELNVPTEVLDCLAHNSTIYTYTKTFVRPICLPFTIEFTLLAGEFLGFCFCHCSNQTPLCTSPQNERMTNGNVANSLERDDDAISSDVEPLDASLIAPDENSPPLQHTGNRCSSSGTIFTQIWTCIVVVTNVLLCVFTLLCKLQNDAPTASSYKNGALYFLFTYWIGMTVAVGIGYYVSRSFRVKGHRMSFSSMDYLLVFTSFGPLVYNAFTCIAVYGLETVTNDNAYGTKTHYVTKAFYVALEVFNSIQVHLQTTFSLYAARIDVDMQRWTSEAGVFKAIILYLAVSNGALWLTATLGGYEFGGVEVEKGLSTQAVYLGRGAWAVIYNIVVPLLLFYRFNSCLVFTRIYRRIGVRRD